MATVPTKPPLLFNVPNQLTAARLGLALVLFALIAWAYWIASILVFTAAAITDWLDGYIARKQGITSSLGRNFDPLVDKVLICGAYIFLIPIDGSGLAAWMATLVVARELIITSLRSFLENAGANFGADWLGKVKMGLQCAALYAVFIALHLQTMPEPGAAASAFAIIRDVLVYAMLAATALSGLQYLWRAAALVKLDSLS